MAGLTVTTVSGASRKDGNRRHKCFDITFDSSYPDNGEALTPATLGMRVVEEFIPHGPFRKSDGSDAIHVSFDRTNNKLIAYWGNAGTASALPEVTDTTDLSAYSGRVTVIGY